MNSNKQCNKCNFFEQIGTIDRSSEGLAGLCRYNPPLLMEKMAMVAQWPVVQAKDWCGKFSN